MIRIILIEDHTLVRQAFSILFRQPNQIQIVGEAGSGAEGVSMTRELKPDVVLLDMKLPGISGLEVIKRLSRLPHPPKILMVSAAHHPEFTQRALKAGALGYIHKDDSVEELISAVKTVSKGQPFLSSSIANTLALAKINHDAHPILSQLNAKELEVFLCTIRCISPPEIGKLLRISSKTIHSYRSKLFKKLQVENDVGMVLLAIHEGLVTLAEAGN